MKFERDFITGTLVNFYATCKREAWLFSRKIHPYQDDENVMMGRALAKLKEESLDDFPFSNLHFDKISRERGSYIVTEYKKSLRNIEGAKRQLQFYLWQLKRAFNLRKINGRVISKKRVIFVSGDERSMREIENILDEMVEFLNQESPPAPKKIIFCKKCAYRDYCF